jgi:hypothetical protein
MGSYRCFDCDSVFYHESGGGFGFHSLDCDKCGKHKLLDFSKLRDIQRRHFHKHPAGCGTTWLYVREVNLGNNQDTYYTEVERAAGNCECEGKYRFNAPTRCPKCKSTNVQCEKNSLIADLI